MSTINRIIDFITTKGLNKNEFYKITGLSNGYLDKVKSIGADKIEIILNNFPDINLKWLITGNGAMLESGTVKNDENYKERLEELKSALKDKERIISMLEKEIAQLRAIDKSSKHPKQTAKL